MILPASAAQYGSYIPSGAAMNDLFQLSERQITPVEASRRGAGITLSEIPIARYISGGDRMAPVLSAAFEGEACAAALAGGDRGEIGHLAKPSPSSACWH